VLAIALAKRGVPVLATDIDPIAVRIARYNALVNGVGSRVAVQLMPKAPRRLPLPTVSSGYDLVVANILMGPLMTLGPALAENVAPAGTVILSGLLPDQRIPIVATYRSVGLRLQRWFIHAGWLTVVMERPGKPGRRWGHGPP
jgi:ribosomal protein L11 methyltransferase